MLKNNLQGMVLLSLVQNTYTILILEVFWCNPYALCIVFDNVVYSTAAVNQKTHFSYCHSPSLDTAGFQWFLLEGKCCLILFGW